MIRILLFALITSVSIVSASAAIFIKLDGIDGESTDKDHKDWIDIISVSGLPPASDSVRSAGSSTPGNLVLTRQIDKASPKLAEMCTTGTDLGDITLSQGGNTYIVKNAVVVSHERKGDQEVISLRYTEFSLKPIRMEATADANHNTTRSKTQAVPAPDSQSSGKATGYNSSRSNRTL